MKLAENKVRRYRVLNPCALPSGSIIIERDGVGQFRVGETMDDLTFTRLGGRSLIMSGVAVEFHV